MWLVGEGITQCCTGPTRRRRRSDGSGFPRTLQLKSPGSGRAALQPNLLDDDYALWMGGGPGGPEEAFPLEGQGGLPQAGKMGLGERGHPSQSRDALSSLQPPPQLQFCQGRRSLPAG